MRRYIHVKMFYFYFTCRKNCGLTTAMRRYANGAVTTMRRYVLRVRVKCKMLNFYFYFYSTRPKAPLGGMGRRAQWHSLHTAGKTIHDKRARALIKI